MNIGYWTVVVVVIEVIAALRYKIFHKSLKAILSISFISMAKAAYRHYHQYHRCRCHCCMPTLITLSLTLRPAHAGLVIHFSIHCLLVIKIKFHSEIFNMFIVQCALDIIFRMDPERMHQWAYVCASI